MVVSSDAVTIGEKELKTKWPVEEGLEAGTTKQYRSSPYLRAQGVRGVKSIARRDQQVGL